MDILIIYIIGFIGTALCIRLFPSLNKSIHKHVDVKNPAVAAVIVWPMTILWVLIYHTSMCSLASINWITGNGFVIKTKEVQIRRMGIR
ncbi:hypothetical protein LCGC14_1007480 [marine sediment metagenome]|uniref:Uncharacterized protein n=1 Tax=marine sediment metagenome TaxID=412755 RepID=A0A0F9N1B8_9ZZZZ